MILIMNMIWQTSMVTILGPVDKDGNRNNCATHRLAVFKNPAPDSHALESFENIYSKQRGHHQPAAAAAAAAHQPTRPSGAAAPSYPPRGRWNPPPGGKNSPSPVQRSGKSHQSRVNAVKTVNDRVVNGSNRRKVRTVAPALNVVLVTVGVDARGMSRLPTPLSMHVSISVLALTPRLPKRNSQSLVNVSVVLVSLTIGINP